MSEALGESRVTMERVPSLKEIYPQYDIGEGSYGDLKVFGFVDEMGTKLRIGAYSSFALDCRVILGGEHRTDWVTTYPFASVWGLGDKQFAGHPASKGDVWIGSDVWVGSGALILSGITIGDGAVIGAGAVVTRDVPAYAVAYGNPARAERFRCSIPQIQSLMGIRWWEWPRARIEAALPFLLSPDVDEFIRRVHRCEL